MVRSVLSWLPALWLLPLAVALGSEAQPAGSQVLTVVTVDFRALAPDGTPVVDLKPEEVSLRVGGRAREIVALELMKVESGSEATGTTASPPPPPPFATNVPPAAGRDVMLVVDEEGIRSDSLQSVKDALGVLVGALSSQDRVGLLTSGTGGTFIRPTASRQPLSAAVAGLTGRASRAETAADAACRTRGNLDALGRVFEEVVPAVPTVVVLTTNGMVSPAAIRTGTPQSGPAGPCEITARDLDAIGEAAVASHADLFVLQVVDIAAGSRGSGGDLTTGLEHVAGLTGNSMVQLTGNSDRALKRIASETSAYYLAAFEVPAAERGGGAQRVEVKVTRQGVEVRAPKAVVMQRPDAKGGRRAAPQPRDMLSSTKVFRDLPLQAIAYTSRISGDGKPRVMAVAQPADPSRQLTAASIVLFDTQGKARAQWTARADDLKRTPLVAALAAPPAGTYRVRIAATDASGAGGTVDVDLIATAADESAVWLGSLVLGVQAGNSFAPRLQFLEEQVALGMVEIAGVPKTAKLAVNFELAGSESGPALATLAGSLNVPREGLQVGYFTFPIGDMPPGDVVVRAVVTVDGQPVAIRPVRTMRKIGR